VFSEKKQSLGQEEAQAESPTLLWGNNYYRVPSTEPAAAFHNLGQAINICKLNADCENLFTRIYITLTLQTDARDSYKYFE